MSKGAKALIVGIVVLIVSLIVASPFLIKRAREKYVGQFNKRLEETKKDYVEIKKSKTSDDFIFYNNKLYDYVDNIYIEESGIREKLGRSTKAEDDEGSTFFLKNLSGYGMGQRVDVYTTSFSDILATKNTSLGGYNIFIDKKTEKPSLLPTDMNNSEFYLITDPENRSKSLKINAKFDLIPLNDLQGAPNAEILVKKDSLVYQCPAYISAKNDVSFKINEDFYLISPKNTQ